MMTTLSLASWRANSIPMPLLPPVIKIVLPVIFIIGLLHLCDQTLDRDPALTVCGANTY